MEQPEPPARRAGPGQRLGSVAGVPVYASASWVIAAVVITVIFAPAVTAQVPGIGAFEAHLVAFVFAVLLYASVFVHELGHALTALRLGLPVRRITLHLLGGVSEIAEEPPTPGRELLVSAAGPLLSLVIGGVALVAARVVEDGTFAFVLLMQLAIANLLVAAFNLLPGLPLDGGRLLRAAVWAATGRPNAGTRVAAYVGRGLALLVVAAPIAIALGSGGQPSLLGLLWAALIAAFIWSGATQALASARLRERLPELRAAAFTRRALPVLADLPLAEALRRLQAEGAGALVVVDREDRPIGIVSEAAVRATPIERRPWVPVGDLARRIEPGSPVAFDLQGEDLVRALGGPGERLVVDAQGRVFGVLSVEDVGRALSRR
jgi:Zn-dependent protease/CBS domain-containing protein